MSTASSIFSARQGGDAASILRAYQLVRRHSDTICETLEPEDCVIQSMPDVSPIRWHLAHTTWFFETFVLNSFTDWTPRNEQYEFLFNSYYNTVGQQFPRHRRGLLSRPTVRQIKAYRREIDEGIEALLESESTHPQRLYQTIELGLQHEQQHQELMLTDIKHVFSCNPLYPALVDADLPAAQAGSQAWSDVVGGLEEIGHSREGFAFDNESPTHRVFLEPFRVANRLVTNAEYLEFIRDGGYQRPELWLSLGWSHVGQHGWQRPLYWQQRDNEYLEFTLGGLRKLDPASPVTHVSYFEADAFARWSGHRLATEFEWETVCRQFGGKPVGEGARGSEDFFDAGLPVHPMHVTGESDVESMFGSVWQWTSSSYAPYPGYQPPSGALGEYNGKFMCNQYVLRGSSCGTSRGHSRVSYRNFFPPEARWQFTGIRLAESA